MVSISEKAVLNVWYYRAYACLAGKVYPQEISMIMIEAYPLNDVEQKEISAIVEIIIITIRLLKHYSGIDRVVIKSTLHVLGCAINNYILGVIEIQLNS